MGDIDSALPSPDWLKQAWAGARQRGVDTLTQDDINAEIADYRHKTPPESDGKAEQSP